jgi:predicted MFS family arabinose efflux permease
MVLTPSSAIARPSAAVSGKLPLLGLIALSAAAFTDVMTDLLPAGLLPQMGAALHVSEAQIGYLLSAFAIASAAAAIPVTAVLRRVPRRAALSAALAGFAVFDSLTAASSSYLLTLAARLLVGVMGGALWSMLAGYAARMVPAARRGRAIAIVLAGITLALCVGVPAGTALADAVGWRASFALLAALALVLVGWVRWKVPAFPRERAADRPRLSLVARRPGIRSVLLVTALLLTAHQAVYTYIAPVAAHAGFGRTSMVLFFFGAATVAGIWMTGLLADRHLRSMLCAALATIAAAMLGIGLAAASPAVLLASVAAWGAAFGGAPTLLQTALIEASGAAGADIATSMQTTVYNVGIAAGSLAGGLVLDGAGPSALPWVSIALVAGALAIVAGRRSAFPARTGGVLRTAG